MKGIFPMARAKTVSLRQLQAAVTKALDAAKREHPEFKTDAITLSASPDQLPVLYRYPWFCGYPPFPWVIDGLGELGPLTEKFVANLNADPSVSAVAADGKFQAAIQYSGGTASIGFVPADVSFVP
jgi:hypothetical protein